MKFGLLMELQHPRPWTETSERDLFHETLDQVELADQLKHGTAHRDYTGKKQRYNGLTERERQVLNCDLHEQYKDGQLKLF